MTKLTPILGHEVTPLAITTPRPYDATAIAGVQHLETETGRQDLSALAGAFEWLKQGVAAKMELLPPELRAVPPPFETKGRELAADASDGLRKIAELYADRRIDEGELHSLAIARGRLEKVLEMESAIGMLPPPVQRRLRDNLFDPLRMLVDAANRHSNMIREAVEKRDVEAIKLRYGSALSYAKLDLSQVSKRSDINGAHRYQIGDPIRIALESGEGRLGFVTGRKEDGSLIAEWLDTNDQVHIVEMSPEKVAKENPLKIGDTFQNWGHQYWVTGIAEDQKLRIVDERGNGYEAFAVLNALMPLERIDDLTASSGFFGGNVESKTIFLNKGSAGEVGLHTHKGYKYSHDWNEDAGCAFVDGRGRIYAAAFDQAGGEGTDPNAYGAASKIAGQEFFQHAKGVALRGGTIEDGIQAMLQAVQTAHQTVRARGFGEATTFVGAMIDGRQAGIVNLGDSGAMHFRADGTFVEKTQDQGIGHMIFDAIGYPHEEGRLPKPDVYRWNVSQGEYIVLGSDGLLDAKLTEQEIGRIVANAGSAEQATRALRDEVVRRMKTGEGKRDNLTVSVIRVGAPS